MDAQQCKSLQKFDDPKTEILKKRLLNSVNTSIEPSINQNNSQHNVLLNALRVSFKLVYQYLIKCIICNGIFFIFKFDFRHQYRAV